MDTAIARAKADGIDPGRMTAADFPVPSGERLFRAARETLDLGRGFHVFAGFPVDRYDLAACRVAYCGVAANLGALVDQATAGTGRIAPQDRQSVVLGKSVSVRVDLGGSRITK